MWYYDGKQFGESDILESYVGFVYLITRLDTGKKYIGKKLFRFKRTKRIKGKKKRFKVASDWETYYGSNKELAADVENLGEENFKREILHLCSTKGICSYLETKEILMRDALLSEDFYNGWVAVKISRSHIGDLINGYKKKSEQKEA